MMSLVIMIWLLILALLARSWVGDDTKYHNEGSHNRSRLEKLQNESLIVSVIKPCDPGRHHIILVVTASFRICFLGEPDVSQSRSVKAARHSLVVNDSPAIVSTAVDIRVWTNVNASKYEDRGKCWWDWDGWIEGYADTGFINNWRSWNWTNSVALDLLYWTVDRLIQTAIAALKHSQMSSSSRSGNYWSWTSSVPSGPMSRAVDYSIMVVDCSISLITMKTGLQRTVQAVKRRNRPSKWGTGLRRNRTRPIRQAFKRLPNCLKIKNVLVTLNLYVFQHKNQNIRETPSLYVFQFLGASVEW